MWDNETPDINEDIKEIERIQADIARDLAMPATEETASLPPVYVPGAALPVPQLHYTLPPPRKRGAWKRKLAIACIVCTLGTASFGFAFGAAVTWLNERNATYAPLPQSAENNAAEAVYTRRHVFETVPEGGVATLADMIELVAPSVVALTTVTDTALEGNQGFAPIRNGTGVIFAKEAERVFIVTSHYVVQQGTQVFVRFSCGAVVMARPFANDQDINIAVIFVDRDELAEAGVTHIALATFGDSSEMRMGDTVIALGNARGEGISATRGVISTEEHIVTVRARTMNNDLDILTLQTDASINYGDSGGPLLNARGQVVGIIDASINLFGHAQAEGIGHSIASNMVEPSLYILVNRLRPAIGILGGDLTAIRAEALGIPHAGVSVTAVMENGAAQNAGLLPGDIITGFDDAPVLDMNQLRGQIAALRPGDTIEMRILRDGAAMVLQVVLLPMEFDRF